MDFSVDILDNEYVEFDILVDKNFLIVIFFFKFWVVSGYVDFIDVVLLLLDNIFCNLIYEDLYLYFY